MTISDYAEENYEKGVREFHRLSCLTAVDYVMTF